MYKVIDEDGWESHYTAQNGRNVKKDFIRFYCDRVALSLSCSDLIFLRTFCLKIIPGNGGYSWEENSSFCAIFVEGKDVKTVAYRVFKDDEELPPPPCRLVF